MKTPNTFEEYKQTMTQYMDADTNNHIQHVAENAWNAGFEAGCKFANVKVIKDAFGDMDEK